MLVTGAGGFIGSVLTKHLLNQNYSVIALVHKNTDISFYHPQLRWCVGDVRDYDFLTSCMEGVNAVVHLAARKSDEQDSHAINVIGTKNVLDACSVVKVKKFIQFSTISTKFLLKGLYAETKKQADDMLKNDHTPVVILKPSVVYGDRNCGIFATIINLARFSIIPVVGTGSFTVRPIYVQDVAIAVDKILKEPYRGMYSVFDLGGPELVTFNDLIRQISKSIYNKRVFIFHIPMFVGKIMAQILELLFVSPPITRSNIVAMNQIAFIDYELFLKTFNFQPRTVAQGLEELKKNNELQLTEPCMMLRYIRGGGFVDQYYIELYKQATIFFNLDSYVLSPYVAKRHWCIGGLDAVTRLVHPNGVFQRKLLIASAVMECCPVTSDWLLPKKVTITQLLVQSTKLTIQSIGKIIIGIFILCIPSVYKNNI